MIGMIQMSTPCQRTFCEVIGQKLLVEMLATTHSPFSASSPLMTSLWCGMRNPAGMSCSGSGGLAAIFTVSLSFGSGIGAGPMLKNAWFWNAGEPSPDNPGGRSPDIPSHVPVRKEPTPPMVQRQCVFHVKYAAAGVTPRDLHE